MRSIDVPLLASTLALCLLGALVLDSVTAHAPHVSPEMKRQALAMAVGLLLALALSRLPPSAFARASVPLYLFGVSGLLAVRFIGHISHGARRWISLGPLGEFQPSEPAKLVLLIAVATLLANGLPRVTALRTLGALLLAAVPCALILTQPDLGTAVVLAGTTMAMLIVSGASPILLVALCTSGVLAAPHFMHSYQQHRLTTYMHPELDPMGMGYNLIQARTAVGSGRIWGDGLFAGPMSQHGFVPENHTDFIFSAIGEELGLVGGVGFLLLYAILIGCVVRTALAGRTRLEVLLATGVAAMLSLHVAVNIGMVIGLVPATGLPLPFTSYGGSAVITHFAALGVVLSVYRSRVRDQDAAGEEQFCTA
ncbi:MAG: rod shape-determining protein RodA [Candidatus Xenobia bacterium]